MESTNFEIFIITLVAALVGSFIGFIAKNIYEKYFSITPKINVSVYGKLSGGHSNFDKNRLKVHWSPTIRFTNISNFNAINFQIHYLNADSFKGSISSPMYFMENHILRGFETEDRYLSYERLIDQDQVKDREKLLSDFMPLEVSNLSFLLTFENEKRKKFYIEFENDQAKTYKIRRSRFKKYNYS